MKDHFELRFRLSKAEFCAAHRAYLRESLVTTKSVVMITLAILLGFAQAVVFGPSSAISLIFVCLWFAVVGLISFVFVVMPGRIYGNHPELAEEQKVVTKTSGVDWQAGKNRRLISWKDISRISVAHPKFVYLYPQYGYPHVIPKEAFSSIDDLNAFAQFVQSQIRAVQERASS